MPHYRFQRKSFHKLELGWLAKIKCSSNFEVRGLQWNLTKSIRKRRLSLGLICIRFDDLTKFEPMSNSLFLYEFRSTKNWSHASFWWFDRFKLFAVSMIWQIRTDFGSKFVKSSKRRTKNTSRESFWSISSQKRSEWVKSSKRRTIEIWQIIKTKHAINFS